MKSLAQLIVDVEMAGLAYAASVIELSAHVASKIEDDEIASEVIALGVQADECILMLTAHAMTQAQSELSDTRLRSV